MRPEVRPCRRCRLAISKWRCHLRREISAQTVVPRSWFLGIGLSVGVSGVQKAPSGSQSNYTRTNNISVNAILDFFYEETCLSLSFSTIVITTQRVMSWHGGAYRPKRTHFLIFTSCQLEVLNTTLVTENSPALTKTFVWT